jgi:glutamate-1-semialdehyde aminotransferase
VERSQRALEAERQQQRALEAIRAVQSGADPTAEALRLANEFTDERTSRLMGRLRRKRR